MATSSNISSQGVWNRVFDSGSDAVRAGANLANPPAQDYSFQEILNRIFDESTNELNFGG